jgi:hypothetical protein
MSSRRSGEGSIPISMPCGGDARRSSIPSARPHPLDRATIRSDEVFHRDFCSGSLAVIYWFFTGTPESTAATPSGLMLKARNINGSLPGFAHWCTRSYGS